jgi:hypothetical protein
MLEVTIYRFEYFFMVTKVTIVTKWDRVKPCGILSGAVLQMLHATLLHVTIVRYVTVKKKSVA